MFKVLLNVLGVDEMSEQTHYSHVREKGKRISFDSNQISS